MRISSPALIGLLALGACTQPKAVAMQEDGKGGENGIACRLGDQTAFENVCAIDRIDKILIVRQPDGGFRRLAITDDGKGVKIAGDKQIEVAIGGNSYRLPATLKGTSAPTP